ncbi:MAG: glycosyltransferase family 2 protein [Wenzhouxiangellaceae bacterium]|nr:MAG: glycosyltransferase family 2 protein [Wenzhouxiangellaceae bacterium]
MSAESATAAPLAPPATLARVTAVIVNYNSGPWLARCIRALKGKGARLPLLLVIDNASDDDSLDNLPPMPGLDIVRNSSNLGFGRGVNSALERVTTPYLLILNPDCLMVPEGLAALVRDMDAHPEAGLVSGRIYDMSGNEQRGSRRQLPGPRRVLNEFLRFRMGPVIDLTHLPSPSEPGEVEAVSGACMLVRTEAFRALNGFDAGFPMHFEDLDLMSRLQQAGWTVRLVPDVAISHAGGVSSRRRPVRVMVSKHHGLWRYLNKHCRNRWPVWVRPLWWLGIWLHAALMVPVVLWRRR